MQAMIYSAHQLKAITDNQYQYMMRQVSKKGWRTNEPGDTTYYFIKLAAEKSHSWLRLSHSLDSWPLLFRSLDR